MHGTYGDLRIPDPRDHNDPAHRLELRRGFGTVIDRNLRTAPAQRAREVGTSAGPRKDSVAGRLVAAGISPERIAQHLAAGRVWVDGVLCVNPDEQAPKPAVIVLMSN